jgi:Fe2+ transport system protein B
MSAIRAARVTTVLVKKAEAVALIGFESSGKSSLFNLLTQFGSSDERNFRGSTVFCRQYLLSDNHIHLVDTPGINLHADSETTKLALDRLADSDSVLMVIKATNALEEWRALSSLLHEDNNLAAIILTFPDKVIYGLSELISILKEASGREVVAVNARYPEEDSRSLILETIQSNHQIARPKLHHSTNYPLENVMVDKPPITILEHKVWGPLLASFSLIVLFALPVWLAWHLSNYIQPAVDSYIIAPLKTGFGTFPPFIYESLFGSYGLLTLGIYSFIWAFPVVLLIALSVALTEDSGLKERITVALDIPLRRIGLNGKDLIPILSGYGCNVVAVHQSRSCSRCTRGACVSMITFGSACSYQIGASLSIFNASQHPWLFAPYILLLFLASALHTKFWYPSFNNEMSPYFSERTWLQWPKIKALKAGLKNSVLQFIKQAMPIFLIICILSSTLDYFGFTAWCSYHLSPLLKHISLPGEVMPGIVFSFFRKDGLMVLNQDSGHLLQSLGPVQTLLLVWLSSTLVPCLVTVFTIAKEFSVRMAFTLLFRQITSSVLSSSILIIYLQMRE